MFTSMHGKGKLTIEGTDGYKTITSADIPYRVSENSGIDSETDPEPGESSFQQFVDAVKNYAEKAEKNADLALESSKKSCECATSSQDRKSTRLNSSHVSISYAVFCLKKKKIRRIHKRHEK